MSITKHPRTIIIIGSGCSAGLGIPTMPSFMDKVFDLLSPDEKNNIKLEFNTRKEQLEIIADFIKKVKSASAYVKADTLNIEELYGLAEMDSHFQNVNGDDQNSLDDLRVAETYSPIRNALNIAINLVASDAGQEFITEKETYKKLVASLGNIMRDSQTNEIHGSKNINKLSTLIAYLSLASFKDDTNTHPLFVQFNWDLSLERARAVIESDQSIKNSDVSKENDGVHDFSKAPQIVRPHGGLHWVNFKGLTTDIIAFFEDKSKLISKDDCLILLEYLVKICREEPIFEKHKKIVDNLSEAVQEYFSPKEKNTRPNIAIVKSYFDIFLEKIDSNNAITKLIKKNIIHDVRKLNHSDAADAKKFVVLVRYVDISPPTWKKDVHQFIDQWRTMRLHLQQARRIIFIGYSMPKSDLYFRHFLALALAENYYSPKVYVWNPSITKLGPVRESFTDIFAPLAKDGRLLGIDGYFGDDALYDLNRVFKIAKSIES